MNASTEINATTARIEVFRPGTFTPMEGDELSYTAADLRAIADAYDFETAPAPIVVGHPSTDAPAYGWVTGFEFDATSERLYATVAEIDEAFSEAVKKGRYKKVSMSFFGPEHAANPQPGTWYPKHLGFLGGAAPAVSGLKNVKFSIPHDEAVTFEAAFGHRGFQSAASLLQGLREFLIDRFGMEDADQALPSYEIEWLADTEVETTPPRFSAPDPTPDPKPKEPVVADPTKQAEFAQREEELKKREAALKTAENAKFASALVEEGRLLPASEAKVVALLGALPVDETVSFAEGEAKLSPVAALQDILKAQPKVVEFGKTDLPPEGKSSTAAFASDGQDVDPDKLELHNKALGYLLENPKADYATAIRAVS